MSNKLALFDFDGTITTKDSLTDFIQYAVGKPSYYIGLFTLSPMLTAYTLKLIPNHIAKENIITHFFKDWDAEQFQELAERYSREEIDKITRPKAMEKIRWHQEQGHKVVIVSASMECWVKAWCDINNIDLISTRLEIKNKKLTGKFATKNCYGIEKVNRVQEAYDISQYDHIYAYGDSRGDKELLALADESFYRPFRG
ncbi:MAG: HAD family hydrolase [Desulfamplus sp.]|nr:HAD family hydrolase [Desulfamplus sp.]